MLNMQEGNTDYILQAMVSMAAADGAVDRERSCHDP